MKQNNNISVLPFYDDLDFQNHKKSYAYGRYYPLISPLGVVPPFQLEVGNVQGVRISLYDADGITDVNRDRLLQLKSEYSKVEYIKYKKSGVNRVVNSGDKKKAVGAFVLYNLYENVLVGDRFTLSFDADVDSPPIGGRFLVYFRNENGPLFTEYAIYEEGKSRYVVNSVGRISDVSSLYIYPNNSYYGSSVEDVGVATFSNVKLEFGDSSSVWEIAPEEVEEIENEIKEIESEINSNRGFISTITINGLYANGDYIINPGNNSINGNFKEGKYYIEIDDGGETWYSDVFYWINGVDDYLKLEWWDSQDLIFDSGKIIYDNQFKNRVYLCAELGKPEYIFSEQGEERDGYFFAEKQISEKQYRFNFLACEYLCDVLRFVRMADHVKITDKNNVEYDCDTILLTPTWQTDGDLANVEVEFQTNTVAKKIGKGYYND